MLTISQLFIYPIKSLGGVNVSSAVLTDRGLAYDRRWMLVDGENQFLSQRELPAMALLKTEITAEGIKVIYKASKLDEITIPFTASGEAIEVKIWDDRCTAVLVDKTIDKWFTEKLCINCRLVYMPDESVRLVDSTYAKENEVTSFSDGYPLLLIGQASLDDLNTKMKVPIPMNRFRPNIVFSGGKPFEEDTFEVFEVAKIQYKGVKLCSRCVVTTIEQATAADGVEPLKTLATYRKLNNKIYFGQNLLYAGEGCISVGDLLTVLKTKQSVFIK
jgi:uncharacterized protein